MRSLNQPPTLAALILAGGRSQRMGTDKALLKTPDGQPLLTRTAQVAQQLTSDIAVVTPWPDRYRSLLLPEVSLIQEQTAADRSSTGPLSGFAQGWAHIHADWCLLLACDMPYLQPEPLSQWWAWLCRQQISSTTAASLIPHPQTSDQKHWEPLCGFYHRQCLPALHRHLGAQDSQTSRRQRSFQAWLKDLSVIAYTDFPPARLFNCNTPDDWAIAQQNIS